MKIIACMNRCPYDPKWLIEITSQEIEKITGYSDRSRIETGASFDVRKAWNLVQTHIDSKQQLENAAKTLRALADLCEQQAPSLLVMEQA